jgi:hypothetical protein
MVRRQLCLHFFASLAAAERAFNAVTIGLHAAAGAAPARTSGHSRLTYGAPQSEWRLLPSSTEVAPSNCIRYEQGLPSA